MRNKQTNTDNIVCPECDTPLNVSAPLLFGTIVECPACGTESEIVSLTPLQLAPLEEEK